MDKHTITCPGCGMEVDELKNKPDEQFNAIIGCRESCYELSYYTLELKDPFFIHQLVVDAYAAQHTGPFVKSISTAFALVGLYLYNEKNYTGRQIQLAHMELANKSKSWPHFDSPHSKHWMTVKDVLALSDIAKEDAIKQWSSTVWDVWRSQEYKVKEIMKMIE